MVLASTVSFRLVCAPDSRDAEEEVNQILKENPSADVELREFKVAEKYARTTERVCPKCGGRLNETRSPQFAFTCADCKRAFTQEDADKCTRTVYTRAGNFFIIPIILKR